MKIIKNIWRSNCKYPQWPCFMPMMPFEETVVVMIRIHDKQIGSDGSAKYLLTMDDGLAVEAVYLYESKHKTFGVCLSTQVGCNMGCVFCATALQKAVRNLTADEIVDQARVIVEDNPVGVPFRYVTLAGMGEPLDNFENSLMALKHLRHHQGYTLKEVSLSTIGQAAKLKRLLDDPEVNFRLYLSLAASNDELRMKLIPAARSHRMLGGVQRIADLISRMDLYGRKLNDRGKARVSYMLLKGVNDSPSHLDELSRLLEGQMVVVQILYWNPVDRPPIRTAEMRIPLARPSESLGLEWAERLNTRGIPAYAMPSFGKEVLGGCGQLSTRSFGYQVLPASIADTHQAPTGQGGRRC